MLLPSSGRSFIYCGSMFIFHMHWLMYYWWFHNNLKFKYLKSTTQFRVWSSDLASFHFFLLLSYFSRLLAKCSTYSYSENISPHKCYIQFGKKKKIVARIIPKNGVINVSINSYWKQSVKFFKKSKRIFMPAFFRSGQLPVWQAERILSRHVDEKVLQ